MRFQLAFLAQGQIYSMEKIGEKITLTAIVFSEDDGFLCAGSQR